MLPQLPEDALLPILRLLDARDLCAMRLTCRAWLRAVDAAADGLEAVWERRCRGMHLFDAAASEADGVVHRSVRFALGEVETAPCSLARAFILRRLYRAWAPHVAACHWSEMRWVDEDACQWLAAFCGVCLTRLRRAPNAPAYRLDELRSVMPVWASALLDDVHTHIAHR